MVVFASTTPTLLTDGLPYATNAVMTTVEGDLFNQVNLVSPIPVPFEQALLAVVNFTAGSGATAPTYVVAQTTLDNGKTWIDLAWCQWSGTSGSATFVLSAGVAGANAFQQTRKAGTAPGGNGSNQCPLGGQLRFVGKTGGASSSSPTPGSSPGPAAMTVSINYKLLGLR